MRKMSLNSKPIIYRDNSRKFRKKVRRANKKRWKKFFKKENYDFDYGSIYTFLENKLTALGLVIFNGHVADPERKNMVREIWTARKMLKYLLNNKASEQAEKEKKDKFFQKFGVPFPESVMTSIVCKDDKRLRQLIFYNKYPKGTPKKLQKEMNTFIDEIARESFKRENDLSNEMRVKLFSYIGEHLEHWWD